MIHFKLPNDILYSIAQFLDHPDLQKIHLPLQIKADLINHLAGHTIASFGQRKFDQSLQLLKRFHNQKIPIKSLKLTLFKKTISSSDILEIAEFAPHLQTLNLFLCKKITDRVLGFFINQPIQHLNLGYCKEISDQGLLNLQRLPLLTLNLKKCKKITDQGLANISNLALKTLILVDCPMITDKGLESLGMMPLETLDLSWCDNILGHGLTHLNQKTLRRLELSCTKIIPNNLKHLQHSSLTHLDLLGHQTIDKTSFSLIESLPLKFLDLRDCPKLEEAQITQIRSDMPKTTVRF